jgi:hypothetical protein
MTSAFTAGSSVLAQGSSTLFKAFDGVRNEVSTRLEAERARREREKSLVSTSPDPAPDPLVNPGTTEASTQSAALSAGVADLGKTLGGIGAGIGGFFGNKYASFRAGQEGQEQAGSKKGLRPMSLSANKR